MSEGASHGAALRRSLRRASEASSDSLARDWSVVAATIAGRSGRRSSMLDALFVEPADRDLRPRRGVGSATARARAASAALFVCSIIGALART